MGFRFSKRIKIIPGLSLNLSGSGVSLSAGVRGARINIGPRGTYGTVGIPGTGISYRERLGGSRPASRSAAIRHTNLLNDSFVNELTETGYQVRSMGLEELKRYRDDPRIVIRDPRTHRKFSQRELEARIREMETQEQVERAQGKIEQESADLQQLINFWKPLPEVESLEELQGALEKYPFQPQTLPPAAPDWEMHQRTFLDYLAAENKRRWPFVILPTFFSRKRAIKDFDRHWPAREQEIQRAYADDCKSYDERVSQEAQEWDVQEEARTAWLRKLLAGDLEEIYRTASNTISSLTFPFDTNCDLFLEDASKIYTHLDLPEIENVIPATEKQVLASGETREVRRDQARCNDDYSKLVMGLCLFLAAVLFAYLPLLRTVQVAAYTQRPRRKETDPIDTYILDLCFEREWVRQFRDKEENLTAFLAKQGGRFEVRSDSNLARIDPPGWLDHETYLQAVGETTNRS